MKNAGNYFEVQLLTVSSRFQPPLNVGKVTLVFQGQLSPPVAQRIGACVVGTGLKAGTETPVESTQIRSQRSDRLPWECPSGSGQKDRRSLVFCRTLKLVHNSLLGKGLPSEPNIVEIVTLAQVSVTRVFWIG